MDTFIAIIIYVAFAMSLFFLNKLLVVKTADRNFLQIIFWWEIRRILYNFIVLIAGLTSLMISEFFYTEIHKRPLEPGEDFVEPLVTYYFAILCNFSYTFGWIFEIISNFFRKKDATYAPKMFKSGLYFTLFLVFIPAIMHILF